MAKPKLKTPPARFREDSSVLLKEVSGVQLRLTTINRLFIIYRKQVLWPYIRSGDNVLAYDVVNTFEIPLLAQAAIRQVLKKQEDIRKQHALDWDEDEAVYTYN